jgi:hypothetical protein
LETLSSQVLEFEGKARANPIARLSDAYFLGKLLMLPTNVRLDWKVIARYKHSNLLGLVVSDEGKKFYNIDTWVLSSVDLWLEQGYSDELSPSSDETEDLTDNPECRFFERMGRRAKLKNIWTIDI